MRYRIFIAALLYAAGLSETTGQQNPFRLAEKLMLDRDGRLDYVAPLRGLATANQQAFDSDTYGQALVTYRSFVGKTTPPAPISSTTPFALTEGGPLLRARARATRVVLINEAHDQPAHRAYCRRLLSQLAPLGYTIFAVEALSPTDTAINKRKFPLSSSGFYTREPNMGKLLRAAFTGGFRVFSHEITAAQNKEFKNWRKSSNYRDSMQAVNVLALLCKNPKAKIVVLVGYDHVLEKEHDGVKRLATYLHELGQLDPLTIDQTMAYRPSQGSPAGHPMVLVDRTGRTATIGERQGYVDLQIIHPTERLVQGRPDWLVMDLRALVRASIPPLYTGQPCLAQLYDRQEYRRYGEKAIPLDQYLTVAQQQGVRLYGLATGQTVIIRYRPAKLK